MYLLHINNTVSVITWTDIQESFWRVVLSIVWHGSWNNCIYYPLTSIIFLNTATWKPYMDNVIFCHRDFWWNWSEIVHACHKRGPSRLRGLALWHNWWSISDSSIKHIVIHALTAWFLPTTQPLSHVWS